ncbi:MAG TPA: DNA ligase-associated DEXH box helicase [Chitinophagaceae bacterium]|nr:DNA ligase-associated DEXH box helicase [Chitinophagaceae bacterium]
MHRRNHPSWKKTTGYRLVNDWLKANGREPFSYQEDCWEKIGLGKSGLVNAPTGFGKTYSVLLGALVAYINAHPDEYAKRSKIGLQLIWVTPLRALAKDIARAIDEVLTGLNLPWKTAIRNGDTPTAEREKQKKHPPEILVTTPESLHLLLAQKNYAAFFENLQVVVVDEWHELLGSKRGVLVELAIARLAAMRFLNHNKASNKLCVWGLSATIGNLDEALLVLTAPIFNYTQQPGELVRSGGRKNIEVSSIIPIPLDTYPWAGHLGLKLADHVLPVINEHQSTLIFINTRGMSERWYQHLLNIAPDLAGILALHHGSIDQPIRIWVEEALHEGKLKAVVCTASLDLGVDFRPVEAVIQVGSPKAVSRFLQRAGRSGHQPGATSRIIFLPTHSLELMEVAALREAIRDDVMESRVPLTLCFDVLIQFLCTLAVSDGFIPSELLPQIRSTHCFAEMTEEEWNDVLLFIRDGGKALQQYDDYKKVEIEEGRYRIRNRRMAMRHRLSIGAIVSDAQLKVKMLNGGFVGVIEEWFISRLNPGDVFTLAGRNLEFIRIKDMTVQVKKSDSDKSIVPSWMGGRMPLSANLGRLLRKKLDDLTTMDTREWEDEPELSALIPLFDLQRELSYLPGQDELLIEMIRTKDGYHLFAYPFEGRLVHEAMAMILAYRLSRIKPITFSIAMNDMGFELLSDQPIPIDDTNAKTLFSADNVYEDIQRSVNATEMARRKFRDIAVIGGLLFQGMPGEPVKQRHLQSSASLLFQVFSEYEPDNLLLRQAYREVMEDQMEEARLRDMLQRVAKGRIIITRPGKLTPFCFPIKVDSLNRETLSSETMEDRVKRMLYDL